jgi:glycosyltransferase-like protein LARGE
LLLLTTVILVQEQHRHEVQTTSLQSGHHQNLPKYAGHGSTATCQPVVIAFIAVGSKAQSSFYIAFKSLLQQRSTRLDIHVITDTSTQLSLTQLCQSWQLQDVNVTVHFIEPMLKDVEWIPTAHAAGKYGLVKLMIPQLLRSVTQVIVLDCDLVVVSDISLLWQQFATFTHSQAIGMVPQQSDWYLGNVSDTRANVVWPANGRGFNSGVLLLHLTKLRASKQYSNWTSLLRIALQIRQRTGLADQDVLNLLSVHHPHLFATLPCGWNLQLHSHSSFKTCLAHSPTPHVLHWNSPAKQAAQFPLSRHFASRFAQVESLNGKSLITALTGCRSIPGKGMHSPSWVSPAFLASLADECRRQLVAAIAPVRILSQFAAVSTLQQSYMCHSNLDPASKLLVEANSLQRAEQLMRKHIQRLQPQVRSNLAVHCEVKAVGGVGHRLDVTLATHLSLARWPHFVRLASSWTGPIVAAVYVSDAELAELSQLLHELTAMPSTFQLQIDVLFKDDSRPYPVNKLRNAALQAAQTTHVFMLDVDLTPTIDTYFSIRQQLSQLGSLRAMVIPALESASYNQPRLSLEEAVHGYRSGALRPFRQTEWPSGHRATDFELWSQKKEMAYPVQWEAGFEPYVVLPRRALLRYPEVLDGFGWNKVSYIRKLHDLGIGFEVLSSAAVVHYPHGPSWDLVRYRTSNQRKRCSKELTNKVAVVEWGRFE